MNSTQHTYDRLRNEISQYENMAYWVLQLVTNELGFSWEERRYLPSQIMDIIKNEAYEPVAADKIWGLLGNRSGMVAKKLHGRADQIHTQIAQHVTGTSILDFGCGDGQVGLRLLSPHTKLFSYDVADYRVDADKLPFSDDWKAIAGQHYDTAVAVAVFHHCESPEQEIDRLFTVAKRVIVIESVIDSSMPWPVQALVDWLYNRGMHPGASIPVPGNFKTVEMWESTFAKAGYTVVASENLGIDLPLVPEHHFLFVLEK